MKPYASAPNDVWSLGVILVNLCCGRNPWKRASPEDPTFLAYLKDPGFLKTILPLSSEQNAILRRVFECDPRKRISIPELRHLILECPRFTVHANPPSPLCTAPPTPAPCPTPQQPCQTYQFPKEPFDLAAVGYNTHAYPPSPPAESINDEYALETSEPSLSEGSSISTSSSTSSECAVCSSTSSLSAAATTTTAQLGPGTVASPQIPPNFWGSFIPFMDVGEKTIRQQQLQHPQQQYHQSPLEPAIVVC